MKYSMLILSLLLNFSLPAKNLFNICPQKASLVDTQEYERTQYGRQEVSLVSSSKAKELYSILSGMKNIPYKYVVDGCDARAYLGAQKLYQKTGLKTLRVNLEAFPSLIAETPYTLEGDVDFQRHSALAVCTLDEKSSEIVPYIIDPTFHAAPIAYDEWLDHFVLHNLTDRLDFFYSSMFSMNPNNGFSSTSFESKELSCAHEVNKRFMQEQRKIESGVLPIGVGRGKEVIRVNLCL